MTAAAPFHEAHPDAHLLDANAPDQNVPCDRVYVWDLVVRGTHWLIALSIVALTVTGIYIGRPFLISSGPAAERFVMGWMKVVHFYGAIVFTLAVLARIGWMFVGSRNARWDRLIPIARDRRDNLIETMKFYMLRRTQPTPVVGHNALAGAAYMAVFVLYLVMIATGLGLYANSAAVDSYMRSFAFLAHLFGGAQMTRFYHHVTMWLLLGFTVQHIYSAILVSRVEKNGTIDSIFSGYKTMRRRGGEQ